MIDSRLQTLRVLAAEGTVTATAEALHLTPSTVSHQLRQLAGELDLQLLEPSGRRVRLTASAHTLLRHADVLYADWARASADLQTHRNAEAGHLRLSAISTALSSIACPAVDLLRAAYPLMTFDIHEDPEEDRFRRLLTGETDIALVIPTSGTPTPSDERYEQSFLLEEQQDLIVPIDHPFASRQSVRLEEAADQTWITAGDTQDQHQLLLAACAEAGFTPRLAHSALEWNAVIALVEHHHGIALAPRLVQLSPINRVTRVPIVGIPAPTRRIIACIRRGSDRQLPISRGLAALRQAANELDTGADLT